MLPSVIRTSCSVTSQRHYSVFSKFPKENPFKRTLRILQNQLEQYRKKPKLEHYKYGNTDIKDFPSHVDVVIIGGGIMGSSIACQLKEKAHHGLSIAVIEKDPTYKECSTVLSVGGLRQQFSLPENILMSQYGAESLRNLKGRYGQEWDIKFTPYGYLLLANEKSAPVLERNHLLQKEYKVKNELLSKDMLKARFPWLNVEDVKLGCIGLENEGWFDPWTLLTCYKKSALKRGVCYVNGEVIGFGFTRDYNTTGTGIKYGTFQKLTNLFIKDKNGRVREIIFALCILAGGAQSGEIAKMAGIGKGEGLLSIGLPVEPRKRFVYCFDSQGQDVPGIDTPLTIDSSGLYFRREGTNNMFITGKSPEADKEPDTANLDVDHEYFDTDIWPQLAHRVPAFQSAKVRSSWAGFYEYNTFDENGIIGSHPYHNNLLFATGFSGHGIQQAPAVGNAITELIVEGEFKTIDLTRLGFDRLLIDKPMFESNIY